MKFKHVFRDLERSFRRSVKYPMRIKRAANERARSEGVFIGITGSSGKSTTTDIVSAVLRTKGHVTTQILNNSFDPLTKTLLNSKKSDFVVVETGVGQIGHMKPMATLLRPDIAIVTMIGLEHYSAFRSGEVIAEEKAELVAALQPAGLAVLNADDPLVMAMAKGTNARVVTFGFSEGADCRIVNVAEGAPDGVVLTLVWRGQELVIPTQYMARHFAGPIAAAAIVGLELGVTPENICRAVGSCTPLLMRLSKHRIPGGPVIIADCAKAPLGTLQLAFDALRHVDAPRKRIILGQVSDYVGPRKRAYRTALGGALEVADEVIFVTDWSKPERFLPMGDNGERFKCVQNTREAAEYIAATAMEGEVILLKGSNNFHLERVLLNFTQPVCCWEQTCGTGISCFECGLAAFDFHTHPDIIRQRRWRWLFSRKAVPA